MMKTRINYWSNSKFADYIRGQKKPSAETGSGWKKWENEAKSKSPIRFWIAEEGLDRVQDFFLYVPDKIYSAKYYIVNRWIDQSHALVAHPKHIKPGTWMDLTERMLYCMFDELVDFVEIELAHSNYRWDADKQKQMKWWQVGKWRTRTWRSADAGVDCLTKASNEVMDENYTSDPSKYGQPTDHALYAKETLELYKWWTEVRPARPDIHDASGWSDHCENKRDRGIGFLEDDPDEDPAEVRKILDRCNQLEKEYDQEDEEMLIRLIKIRKGLWT